MEAERKARLNAEASRRQLEDELAALMVDRDAQTKRLHTAKQRGEAAASRLANRVAELEVAIQCDDAKVESLSHQLTNVRAGEREALHAMQAQLQQKESQREAMRLQLTEAHRVETELRQTVERLEAQAATLQARTTYVGRSQSCMVYNSSSHPPGGLHGARTRGGGTGQG